MALTLKRDINIYGHEVIRLATYKDIIQEQSAKLPKEIKWWPNYLYHYTDINHAVSIIEKGWIYGRSVAKQNHLIKTDAASQNVLSVTSSEVKQCGRLYMRPLTPTQFYCEGYKPRNVRHEDYKDVNCPVPIFFLFDAVKTLEYPGVYFVERGAAGYQTEKWKSGTDSFASLNFNYIFHKGPTSIGEIFKQRRTEVLRAGGIPLSGLLRRIVCRTPAEMQTILCLIQTRCPQFYSYYKQLITLATPDTVFNMFFQHGIHLRTIKATKEGVFIEFNEPRLRYDYLNGRKGPVPIPWRAVIYWEDIAGRIIQSSTCADILDYKQHAALNLRYTPFSNRFRMELYFRENEEEYLIFFGKFDISEHDIM